MTEATIDSQLSLEPAREGDNPEAQASEVARLEDLLRERSSELQGQKARARKAEGLVRDLMAQLEAAARLAPPGVADDASASALRARTLEAEFGRAEIQLRFDELLGHFTTLSQRDSDKSEHRAELDASQAKAAQLERSLRATLAEAEEARDFAFARATLLDHDLTLMRDARADVIRELAELREQLELSALQARTLSKRFEHGLPTDQAEVVLGELSGLRFRLSEQERAADVAMTLLPAARADGQEQRRVLGAVRAELSARQVDHREALGRADYLERELARDRERLRELAGQNAKLSADTTALREQLATTSADATLLRNALRVVEEDASAASREVSTTRSSVVHAAQRSAELTAAVQVARQALVSVQAQLRRVLEEGAASSSHDATEPGTFAFDEIDSEP